MWGFVNKHSNGLSAACAVVSLLVGLPSAAIASWQAVTAHKRASEAQAALDKTQALVTATQAIAANTGKNVELMRELAGSTASAADAATKGAHAAELQADYAASTAGSLRSQDASVRSLAQTASDQLRRAQALEEAENRPRLIYRDMELLEFGAGKRTTIMFHVPNEGRSLARSIVMWSRFEQRLGRSYASAPACGSGSGWDEIGNEAVGRFRSAALNPISREDVAEIERQGGFLAYGAVCYLDAKGKQYRTDFCSVVKADGRAEICSRMAAPT